MTTEQSLMAVIRAARPSFRSPHDRVAFAVHAAFSTAGYILHDTGPSAFAHGVLSSSTAAEVGIDNWNMFEDNYAFAYSNPEMSSNRILVKCVAMNNHLMVDVLKDCDSELLHMDIDVKEYVEDNGGTSYASQYKNLKKLVADFNEEILWKLACSLATSSSSQPSSSGTNLGDDTTTAMNRVHDPKDPPCIGYAVPDLYLSHLFPGWHPEIYPARCDFGCRSMLLGLNDARFLGGFEQVFLWPLPSLLLCDICIRNVVPFGLYGPLGTPGF